MITIYDGVWYFRRNSGAWGCFMAACLIDPDHIQLFVMLFSKNLTCLCSGVEERTTQSSTLISNTEQNVLWWFFYMSTWLDYRLPRELSIMISGHVSDYVAVREGINGLSMAEDHSLKWVHIIPSTADLMNKNCIERVNFHSLCLTSELGYHVPLPSAVLVLGHPYPCYSLHCLPFNF